MTTIEQEIAFASSWMSEAAKKLAFGDISVRLVMHGGRVARVERSTVAKTQPTLPEAALTHGGDTKD
jgi:hypothetical protein